MYRLSWPPTTALGLRMLMPHYCAPIAYFPWPILGWRCCGSGGGRAKATDNPKGLRIPHLSPHDFRVLPRPPSSTVGLILSFLVRIQWLQPAGMAIQPFGLPNDGDQSPSASSTNSLLNTPSRGSFRPPFARTARISASATSIVSRIWPFHSICDVLTGDVGDWVLDYPLLTIRQGMRSNYGR